MALISEGRRAVFRARFGPTYEARIRSVNGVGLELLEKAQRILDRLTKVARPEGKEIVLMPDALQVGLNGVFGPQPLFTEEGLHQITQILRRGGRL